MYVTEIEIGVTGRAPGATHDTPVSRGKASRSLVNFHVCGLQSFGAVSASYGVPGINGSERTDEGGLWPTQRNARMLPVAVLQLTRANIAVRTVRELQTRLRLFVFAGTLGAPGRLPSLVGKCGLVAGCCGEVPAWPWKLGEVSCG